MTAEEALVWLLNANTNVATYTGGRIFPLAIPQTAVMPAIAYQRISNAPTRSQTGFSYRSVTRLQLTVQADTYAVAKELTRACRRSLESYRGKVGDLTIFAMFIDNESDGYAESTQSPVVRMDVLMHHDEQ